MSEIKITLLIMYYVTDEENDQIELGEAMRSLETPDQSTYYVIDDEKCFVELGEALDTVVTSTESVSASGQTLTIDGIECYGLKGTINKNTYASGRVEYVGTGNAIFVDKKHDLSYYVKGSDYVNSGGSNQSPGTYGYEWGGYRIAVGGTSSAIGAGLSNTNSLIEKNLRPDTSGWYVVWDKIKEFRQSHSDNWFLPSIDELDLIYDVRSKLSNISLSRNQYYWSSSEYSDVTYAWFLNFLRRPSPGGLPKNKHYVRSRLCVQY